MVKLLFSSAIMLDFDTRVISLFIVWSSCVIRIHHRLFVYFFRRSHNILIKMMRKTQQFIFTGKRLSPMIPSLAKQIHISYFIITGQYFRHISAAHSLSVYHSQLVNQYKLPFPARVLNFITVHAVTGISDEPAFSIPPIYHFALTHLVYTLHMKLNISEVTYGGLYMLLWHAPLHQIALKYIYLSVHVYQFGLDVIIHPKAVTGMFCSSNRLGMVLIIIDLI